MTDLKDKEKTALLRARKLMKQLVFESTQITGGNQNTYTAVQTMALLTLHFINEADEASS